ncbi:MAG: C40 family peptidase [Candidatus Zixiibacteriota bacterium]
MAIAMIAVTAILSACQPYPRYRPEADFTPREQRSADRIMTTREYLQLGSILQRQLGKPYAGRSKWEAGLDCSQYTSDVFRQFNGTQLPRTAAEQYTQGREVARSRLKFGDLVFFRTERDRISHVGVYIGFNQFIHVSTSSGVIISNLSEKYWARSYVGARRILLPPADRTAQP